MKPSRLFVNLIFCVVTLTATLTARAEFVHLTLQSQPGDFIGQGGNYDLTYTPGDLFFFVSLSNPMGPNMLPSEIHFTLGDPTATPNTFSTLAFGTNQLGIPLQPGFYPNAQREPFAQPGHPGLDVTFQNRGSNTLTGNFTITDITLGPSNVLQSFSASFEQHSEGAAPALFGTVTYNINGMPEPSTKAALLIGAAALIVYRLIAPKRLKRP